MGLEEPEHFLFFCEKKILSKALIWYMVDTYSVLDSLPSMPSWFLYVTYSAFE